MSFELPKLDTSQSQTIELLEQFRNKISSRGFFRYFKKHQHPMGAYVWGPVGRGKTMLLQTFYTSLATPQKIFIHFYKFMLNAHKELDALQKSQAKGDYIEIIARKLSKQYQAIFLDELQIDNIADAMLVGRLFASIIKHGTLVFFSSNRHPSDLFKDGLQRQQFEPFIELLQQQLIIHQLDNHIDYRRAGRQINFKAYIQPFSLENELLFNEFVKYLRKQDSYQPKQIKVDENRFIRVSRSYDNLADISFNELCANNLGSDDYLALATSYEIIAIRDIPQLDDNSRNEAIRFIKLIDCLYERKTITLFYADAEINELYKGAKSEFEFKRCISRIHEMANNTSKLFHRS